MENPDNRADQPSNQQNHQPEYQRQNYQRHYSDGHPQSPAGQPQYPSDQSAPVPSVPSYGIGEPPTGFDSSQPPFQQPPPSSNNAKWWAIGAGLAIIVLIAVVLSVVFILKDNSSDKAGSKATDPVQFTSDYMSNMVTSEGKPSSYAKNMMCPNSPEKAAVEKYESDIKSGKQIATVLSFRVSITNTTLVTRTDDTAQVKVAYKIDGAIVVDGSTNNRSESNTEVFSLKKNNGSWCMYSSKSEDKSG